MVVALIPILAGVAFGFLAIYLTQNFLKWREFCSVIDQIPGPKAYPLVGTLLDIYGLKREDFFMRVHKRIHTFKGGFYRLWVGRTPDVRITKAEYAQLILQSNKNLDKSYLYKFFNRWLGKGLITTPGDQKWHHHRKILTPAFHFSILEQFCEVFGEKGGILVRKLEVASRSGEAFNILPLINAATLDVICETAMGTPSHAQNDSNHEYMMKVKRIGEIVVDRLIKPWYHIDYIFYRSKLGKEFLSVMNSLHSFTEQMIQERRAIKSGKQSTDSNESEIDKKKRRALLDLLLESITAQGEPLSDLDIRQEVDNFMFAGHDTTLVAIGWALFLLGHNHDVQEKVVEEQRSILTAQDQKPSLNDLNDMRYLEMVIKESLRIYPSVPIIGRKLSEDVYFDNYRVPKGCMIGVHIYDIHRDERYFPDPEKFDPDRFLPENCENRHPYAFIPFSAGSRNCIGMKFAQLEEKTVLSYIVRNFEIKSVTPREDIHVLGEMVLRPFEGIRLIMKKRNF